MNKRWAWSPFVLLLLLSACTGLPVAPEGKGDESIADGPPDAPAEAPAALPTAKTTKRSPAVQALLRQAREQRSAGEPQMAIVSLERALRIDARDPALWLELAHATMEQGDPSAAGQFAEKARRLAGLDEALAREAEALLRAVAENST